MVKTKKQIWALVAALVAGLYAFWLTPGYWDLGLAMINTLFLGFAGWWFKRIFKNKYLLCLWLISLTLGWCMAIYDFDFVRFLSIIGIFILNGLVIALARKPKAKLGLDRIFRTELLAGFKIPLMVVEGLAAIKSIFSKEGKSGKKIVVGIMAAVPLLLVFGGLFYAADPIFAKLIDQIAQRIKIDEKLLWNTITTLMAFGATMSALTIKMAKKYPNRRWLSFITETNVAVALLEVLFLVFTLIQLRYFFASNETFRAMGVTYSQYTRRGYGEMIIASLLAWGVVFWLEYSLRSQKKLGIDQQKLTRGLSLAIIGEIFIFVTSATRRNFLYQAAYGFTRIRLLGFWLSGWLVTMLLVTLIKIIQSRGQNYFVRRLILVTGFSLVALNLFNIDRMVIMSKPASLDSGVDYRYLSNLSNDAYPGWGKIINELENNPSKVGEPWERRVITNNLLNRLEELEKQQKFGWQNLGAWNYADRQSWGVLKENKERLELIRNQINEEIKTKDEMSEKQRQQRLSGRNARIEGYRTKLARVLASNRRNYAVVSFGDKTDSEYGQVSVLTITSNYELNGSQLAEDEKLIRENSENRCWLDTKSMEFKDKQYRAYTYRVMCE
jgi:hypothetical protein